MTLIEAGLLLASGFVAGVVNAIAGGGTFFSFPVFLALGLPPVVANATNAAAVWPAHPLAAWSARRHLAQQPQLLALLLVSLVGAVLGALALQRMGNLAFQGVIPWLLLLATLLFASGTNLAPWLSRLAQGSRLWPLLALCVMLLVSAYGGFFSAGMGVMLMAGLLLFGVHNMVQNNAIKNLLGALVNTVAVLVWALQGLIDWSWVPLPFAAAWLGGICGSRWAEKISAQVLRRVVVAVGLGLTLFFFIR